MMQRQFGSGPRREGGHGGGTHTARPRKFIGTPRFKRKGPPKGHSMIRYKDGSLGGVEYRAKEEPSHGHSERAFGGERSHTPRREGFTPRDGGSRSFSPRGSFGGSRGGSRFGGARSSGGYSRGGSRGGSFSRGRGGRGFTGDRIDPARFIRKASGLPVGEKPYVVTHQFADFQVKDVLKKNIIGKGYVTPTPIQDQTIPHVLLGKDVVGIANTGTGKTGAFLIPLINKVLEADKTQILIVVPTRELATQIEDELKGFTKGMRIFSTVCVGGAPIFRQKKQLRYHNHFVIGTPGRLKDLVDQGVLRLETFATIVLDEADRMLDMGFIGDMKYLMAKMPEKRHTLFFSATLSREIEGLINQFLVDPVTVKTKIRETSDNVDQDIVRVEQGDKFGTLVDLLRKEHLTKVLIFGRTKHGVERLSVMLQKEGFKAESLHGNKTHGRRERSLTAFKKHHANIMVATDVAARGLDISDISHVINYDLPATYDDYVHRIGRTGRGEKKGHALTFID